MTTQRQEFKRLRAEAIAKCATMIAEYCKADPAKIFTDVQSRTAQAREARSMLIYHLHHCGMSFDRIGKLVKRQTDFCHRAKRDATIRLNDDDRALLYSLPHVPNSLQISQA